MRFGLMLMRLREARGMTQLALAKRSKVAQGYISDLEAGRKVRPSVEVVVKLARTLRVGVADLLGKPERRDLILDTLAYEKPKRPRRPRRRPEFKRRNK